MKPIPTYRGKFFSGSAAELFAGPADFYSRVAWSFDGLARFRVYLRTIYAVAAPEFLHQILVTKQKNYPKSALYRNVEQTIGKGLVSLQGEDWINDRRIIQPGFHKKCIVSMVGTINEACDRIFAEWEAAPVDYRPVVPALREIGLQVISEPLLGTTLASARSARLSETLMAASVCLMRKNWSFLQLPAHWPTPLNRRLNALHKEMIAFLAQQVERRLAEGVGTRGDMLDLLLSAHGEGKLPKERVLGEMLTLFSAGYDTTSSGLSWAVYYLAAHPEYQARLREEVRQVVGDRPPTWEDLEHLPFTEAVFNEAIRLNPPIHTITRTCLEEDQLGDYLLPAGALLVLSLHGSNRSPRHWDRPNLFNPDRFASGAPTVANELAWVPFSSGARRCIGAQFATVEAKLVIARLAQAYRLELKPDSKVRTSASSSQHPEQLFVRFARW
ncbi:MAG: cytochrome P450 [Verrucomicrobiota bacterium]